MKIYTRTGDAGETGLLGGRRVSKSAVRVSSYGEVDELNAAIGVARAHVKSKDVDGVLEEVQRDLFSVGALLADPDGKFKSEKAAITPEDVFKLEKHIDRVVLTLAPLTRFILPGGTPGGSHLHLARTVSRRAERALVVLNEAEPVPAVLLSYLNRLSDLLFVLARAENHCEGVEETPW